MYFFLSFRVNFLFYFIYSGVDAMGEGLKGKNQDKIKYYTSMNSCTVLPLLEYAWKLAAVIIVASHNSGIECYN